MPRPASGERATLTLLENRGARRQPWILLAVVCGALIAQLTLARVQDRQLGTRA